MPLFNSDDSEDEGWAQYWKDYKFVEPIKVDPDAPFSEKNRHLQQQEIPMSEEDNEIQRIGIEVVMAAMTNFAKAQGEHDAALAKYEGYSWSYHGYDFIRAVEEAKDEAKKALNSYIDDVVRRTVLKMLGGKNES